jgi:hypothetical protein
MIFRYKHIYMLRNERLSALPRIRHHTNQTFYCPVYENFESEQLYKFIRTKAHQGEKECGLKAYMKIASKRCKAKQSVKRAYQSTIHVNVRLYAASNAAYKRNGGAYVTR